MVTDTFNPETAIVPPKHRISVQELERRTIALRAMSGSELRSEYRRLFGIECYSHNYAVLRSRCEWKLYTLCHGKLAPEVIKYAYTLANLSMLRERHPAARTRQLTKRTSLDELNGMEAATGARARGKRAEQSACQQSTPADGLKPDSVMTVSTFMSVPGHCLKKTFRGVEHTVYSLSDGRLLYNGNEYKSISAVAKAIAAYKCSGNVFFKDATLIAHAQ